MNNIRNFCIIAHIDHGKSTLADRFLELTNTVSKRDLKEQMLDSMDLERERGITIKLQPARLDYQGFVLNLIDTPGHVDFTYEVSRSLLAVEGAVLLIDASQGIEAQTLSNLYLALEQNLTIIPVVNKIDLPNVDIQKCKRELIKLLGVSDKDILLSSGKTGQGVAVILDEIVKRIPPPRGDAAQNLQALVFDSKYDDYRGVVTFVRVFNGTVKKHDKIYLTGAGKQSHALEVGVFKPDFFSRPQLSAGEIGYIVTGFKDVSQARVGDTITLFEKKGEPLAGYKEIKPMVFAGLFPESGDQYPRLRDAVSEIKLSDASLQFEPEHSPALGFGFRSGFLGMLHLEIIAERLRREYDLNLIITTPSVAYQVVLNKNESGKGPLGRDVITVNSPSQLPDPSKIFEIKEPWAKVEIVTPKDYIGPIMNLIQSRHGLFGQTEYLDENRVVLRFSVPLYGLITDFYDKLKNASSGYASMNYELDDYRSGDIVRLDILVAEEPVEPFSLLVEREDAYETGKRIVAKLKNIIPKQQFVIKLQAAIGGKIVAAERIAARRKDVTAKLYGGDVTRKRKLLEKQKKGKKRMLAQGKVQIPTQAFLEVLKR